MELNSTPTTPQRDTRTTLPARVLVRGVAGLTLGQMNSQDYEEMTAEEATEIREELETAQRVLRLLIEVHDHNAPR
jgi:hypothetical protein